MPYSKRQGVIARYIRDLAELYGFTPKEVGKLTVYQVNVLYAKDGEDAQNTASGIQKVSAKNYNQMTREERRQLMRHV